MRMFLEGYNYNTKYLFYPSYQETLSINKVNYFIL